jgi:DNA-binding NtrC family response regulator
MNTGNVAPKNGFTVLTIEDEEGFRKSIVHFLEDSGFTVFEAADGQEGLAACRTHKPDIVFTDLCMPNGKGLEIIPTLCRENPFMPIVVISGTGMLQDALEAMRRGAWDYLSKPIRDLATLEELALRKISLARKIIRQQAISGQLM